jgi:EmrB/QacA subfamily drug resistance transporter
MEMFHDEPVRADAEGSEPPPELTHRRILLVFGALSLSIIPAVLDGTIVATALPSIAGDLGDVGQLSWVVTAYLLAQTIATPLFGKFGDLFGRKRLFQGATVAFLVASLLAGAAPTMLLLIVCRALQGFAAGGLIVLIQAIIADVVSPRERGRYSGFFGALFGAASIAGPLVGGVLTDALSWRWIFLINVPFCVTGFFLVAAVLPASPRRASVRIDWLGTALLSTGITTLVLLTTWAGVEYAWGSPVIVGLAVATVALVAAFLAVERRAAEPAMPLALFRIRTVVVASAILFIVGTTMFGTIAYLPTFLQLGGGTSASSAGLLLAPQMVGTMTATVISGQILTRTGRYRALPIVGTAVAAIGMVALSTLEPSTSRLASSAYMFVFGVGIGLTLQVLVVAVQNEAPNEHLGVATSTVNFFRAVGGSVGVALFGALYTSQVTDVLGAGATDRITPEALQAMPPDAARAASTAVADAIPSVFLFAVPALLVAFVLAWFLREVPLRTDSGDARRGARSDLEAVEDALLVYADPAFTPDHTRGRRVDAGATTPGREGNGR